MKKIKYYAYCSFCHRGLSKADTKESFGKRCSWCYWGNYYKKMILTQKDII